MLLNQDWFFLNPVVQEKPLFMRTRNARMPKVQWVRSDSTLVQVIRVRHDLLEGWTWVEDLWLN